MKRSTTSRLATTVFAFSFRVTVFSLCCAMVAQAGSANLPGTGQTKCYRAVSPYDEIKCAGTGQDGDIQSGIPWPGQRFTPGTGMQASCVTDNLTGLIWVKAPTSATLTWAEAIKHVNSLDLCGFTDWRMPEAGELADLVNADMPNIATWLNTQGFSNVQPLYYWSSTAYAYDTNIAWIVNMLYGNVSGGYKTLNNHCIWPVRGRQ